MIIRDFHAENILKYADLRLENLPSKGLIGISGANESGKTAIVESICLALFGRTFSYTDDVIHKTMKWGVPKASVDLTFSIGDNTRYRVIRYLNMEGEHSARVVRLDADSNQEQLIAQGARSVTRAVEEACGFNFDQYVESFYLAQREIELPNAGSGMVKGLLGIAELDRVAAELEAEINTARNQIDDIQQQIDDHQTSHTQLGVREDALAQFQINCDQHQQQYNQTETSLSEFKEARQRLNNIVSELQAELTSLRATDTDTRFRHWQTHAEQLSQGIDSLNNALLILEKGDQTDSELAAWSQTLSEKVAVFAHIRDIVDEYIAEQQNWLSSTNHDDSDEEKDEFRETYQSQCDDNASEEKELRRRRRRIRWLALITLALSGGLLYGWWLLTNMTDNPWSGWLQSNVDQILPMVGLEGLAKTPQMTAWKWGGGGALCFSLFMVLRGSSLGRQIRYLRYQRRKLDSEATQARSHLEQLVNLDEHTLPAQVETLNELGHTEISLLSNEFAKGPGLAMLKPESLALWLAPLADAVDIFEEDIESIKTQLSDREHQLQTALKEQQAGVSDAEATVENEQERRSQRDKLKDLIDGLQTQLPPPRQRIKTRKLGLEQIKGTCRRIYNDFNVQMRDYLVRLIPLFTEGRYRHLKIDDDFKVQVFSNDKNDFVELQELSSGTHRQLVLGVRLALSQALVDAHTHGPQSMILDEPFAFFDRERIRLTLKTLPSVSKEISQIWVISQEFDSAGFDLHLRCSRDQDTLLVKG